MTRFYCGKLPYNHFSESRLGDSGGTTRNRTRVRPDTEFACGGFLQDSPTIGATVHAQQSSPNP